MHRIAAATATLLLAAGPAAADPVGEALLYVVKAFNTSLSGHCSGRLEPDRAMISGGISAESLKPTQAHAAIDKRLGAMGEYVAQVGGRLVTGERLRAVRNPPSSSSRAEVADQPKPFVAVQRVDVELPVDADVDVILDRLLVLGLDRFGTDIQPERSSREPAVVVRYLFDDLGSALESIYRQCRIQILEDWCRQNVPGAHVARCQEELTAVEASFKTSGFTLASQPVAIADGRTQSLRFNYPWREQELDRVELYGRVPLELGGPLNLRATLP